jgi:hypothetical protein
MSFMPVPQDSIIAYGLLKFYSEFRAQRVFPILMLLVSVSCAQFMVHIGLCDTLVWETHVLVWNVFVNYVLVAQPMG